MKHLASCDIETGIDTGECYACTCGAAAAERRRLSRAIAALRDIDRLLCAHSLEDFSDPAGIFNAIHETAQRALRVEELTDETSD